MAKHHTTDRGDAFRGDTLHAEWVAPHIAVVTFDRPEERNTLSLAMIKDLKEALDAVASERTAALILSGSGSAFCAGADLKMITSPATGFLQSPMKLRDEFLSPLANLFDSFEEMPFPIIAAVDGYALGGGCEMALSADIRIAATTAVFGLPEVGLGTMPGAGGVQKLIRHVGRSKALEWILLGSRVSAEEAERRGLVNAVVSQDELIPRAIQLGEVLAKAGPTAIAQAKRSIYLSEDADVRTARRYGVEALTSLAGTAEWREGISAFVEKRSARFR